MTDQLNFDFSYSSYLEILAAAKSHYNCFLLKEAPLKMNRNSTKPVLFLRHDIDLDLEKAFEMALIENEFGISSTFMVMTRNPFYSILDARAVSVLSDIIEMGHEIGLHFDSRSYPEVNNSTDITLESRILEECDSLEEITRQKVDSVSFHRPQPQYLRGPLLINGKVNAYAAELMHSYISDSKGIWRVGSPVDYLCNPKERFTQLLVHPIWWGREHRPAAGALKLFFDERTKNMNEIEKNIFDERLALHLTIVRSK